MRPAGGFLFIQLSNSRVEYHATLSFINDFIILYDV